MLDAFRNLAENVRIFVCKECLKAKKGLKTVVKNSGSSLMRYSLDVLGDIFYIVQKHTQCKFLFLPWYRGRHVGRYTKALDRCKELRGEREGRERERLQGPPPYRTADKLLTCTYREQLERRENEQPEQQWHAGREWRNPEVKWLRNQAVRKFYLRSACGPGLSR